MGWHYILRFRCKLKPEYIEFIRGEYLRDQCDERADVHYLPTMSAERLAEMKVQWAAEEEEREVVYKGLSRDWRNLIDCWLGTRIGAHFYEYDLAADGVFTCEISKKVIWHTGDLKEAYLVFLRDVVVRISSVILSCEIMSDDFGEQRWHYTDNELRDVYFHLQDKIRKVVHTYSEDGGEILETRIVYKHGVPAHQHRDLARAYGYEK